MKTVNHRKCPDIQEQSARRRGTLLVLVLIVIAMLSLSGYAFTEMMFVEHMAVTVHSRRVQSTANAESAVELIKAVLAMPPDQAEEFGGLYDNPDRLRGVIVNADEEKGDRLRFTVLTTQRVDDAPASIRYGLTNESTKLNLATALSWDKATPGTGRAALMTLPNMTETVADHLLDWIDADTDPREFGGEVSAYSVLDTPYSPRNGVPRRLEELLLVIGISRPQLLGFDANLNGRVDPIEMPDGNTIGSSPVESIDTAPWAEFLTLVSAEGNLDPHGEKKLNLNTVNVETLTHRLPLTDAKEFAEFVVAYRKYGPIESPLATARSATPPTAPASEGATVTNRNLGGFYIRSFFDLVDVAVSVPEGMGSPARVLQSPISSSAESLDDWLTVLEQSTTTLSASRITGRVNINGAQRVVLQSVPGIDESTAEAIVSRRGSALADRPRHLGWLLGEGIMDLPSLRRISSYVTAGGDVYSFQVVGYFDSHGPVSRSHVTLDATSDPPSVISWNDLGSVPLGFGPEELGVSEGPARR
jgi:DNA uptake protein ComE-like DNA-binding protein